MRAWMLVNVARAADAGSPVGAADTGPADTGPVWPIGDYPGQCTAEDPNFDLEVLYYEGKFREGLDEVKRRFAASSSPSVDLYWMKVRFMYEIGESLAEDDRSIDRMAWYQEMVDTTEQGLAKYPGDLHLRFARGVAMGRLGTTRGVLSSLFMADDIEHDWLAVASPGSWSYASIGGNELLPCDVFHALGIYYRLVPDWWIVQMVAGTRGDLDKSVYWHQKAVACKPNEIQNWKELGATQLCIGTKRNDKAALDAGMASLNRARSLPATTARTRIDAKHASAMIADPSLGCGYSRDGQEDLDEKKLDAQP